MKKILITLLLCIFLTACTNDSVEEVQEVQEEQDREVVFVQNYAVLYSGSVLTIYMHDDYYLQDTDEEHVNLSGSTCYMEGNYYNYMLIFMNGDYYTVNEHLERSINFDINQLIHYGLQVDCISTVTEDYIITGENTNVAYLQAIEEIGTLNDYRLFEQQDYWGCCVIAYLDFIEVDGTMYTVESSTLDRNYFILVDDVYYSLEEAMELAYVTNRDIYDNAELFPKLNIRPDIIIETT